MNWTRVPSGISQVMAARRSLFLGMSRSVVGGLGRGLGQLVSFLVLLAADQLDADVGQVQREFAGLGVQELQLGVLHFVLAGHLIVQQLGVGPDYDWPGAESAAFAQGTEQSLVFGLIVGAGANAAAYLSNYVTVGPDDADPNSSRAGIAE